MLLTALLPPESTPAIPYLSPYLLTSFGSFTRLDYGTGHETSFALFLLCLALIRFLEPVQEQERDLVLIVFLRYLRLCWKLQDVYKLEPAGSHGVWGLDDYSFLGYIFGSAQLRGGPAFLESQVGRFANMLDADSDIPVSGVLHRPLPPTNLYFISISRIHEVKFGPFHEHSSQLYSIATGVPRWSKVNSGLFKMYEVSVMIAFLIHMVSRTYFLCLCNLTFTRIRQRFSGSESSFSIFRSAVYWIGTLQHPTMQRVISLSNIHCSLLRHLRLHPRHPSMLLEM